MNYIKISKYDTANGIGIGVVLWVSGCNCHCHGCHNPSTWDFNAGQPFTKDTMQEILSELAKPYISHFTLSGGHPLEYQNLETVYKIVKTVKEKFPSKTIWLYTGYTWEEILDKDKEYEDYEVNRVSTLDVIKYCDVLVDGRYEDDKRDISLAWQGSSNQRVISVQESLNQGKVVLYCE
jgi:anaerobic ribonucleoside-triphosphate reductase activating protein|nr:MAG TPA: 4Fe-4S single cluster domain protein [Caudoviricetes sp.]